ncbi:hypothetical protein BHE74_00000483 [Ensete ventricosum]|nr:hypothetical protein BHE74_00000483 [Ensete ventricosum]
MGILVQGVNVAKGVFSVLPFVRQTELFARLINHPLVGFLDPKYCSNDVVELLISLELSMLLSARPLARTGLGLALTVLDATVTIAIPIAVPVPLLVVVASVVGDGAAEGHRTMGGVGSLIVVLVLVEEIEGSLATTSSRRRRSALDMKTSLASTADDSFRRSRSSTERFIAVVYTGEEEEEMGFRLRRRRGKNSLLLSCLVRIYESGSGTTVTVRRRRIPSRNSPCGHKPVLNRVGFEPDMVHTTTNH